jgi:hypothetical protein
LNDQERLKKYELRNQEQIKRIAELEKQSEPVAWMDKRTNKCVVFINTPPSDDWIPLYTTPQTKQLSDEEIEPITEMMADMYNQMSLQWKNSRGYSEQCDIMKAIFRAIEAKVRGEK